MAAIGVSSRIEHVTVYGRGARVRRVAAVRLPEPDGPELPQLANEEGTRALVAQDDARPAGGQ